MMTKKNSDWTSYLSTVAFAYNITKHSSTGYSPFELLYGCTAALPPVLYSRMDLSSSTSYEKYLENLICNIIEMQAKAFTSSYEKKILRAQKASHNTPFPQYKDGDIVLFQHTHGTGQASKLDALWSGPFEILEKTSTDVYTLKHRQNFDIVNRVHAKFLKPFGN